MVTAPVPTQHPSSTRNPRLLRDAQAGALVEAFVVIGILTILVTRAYLYATGFPQIGGATLHIAHALWGGLGMVVALVVVFSFLGALPRMVAVVAGGIGFGLFLDEVGKFVTQTNDYFFQPAVAIMYVVVVALLLVNRWIHDARQQTTAEDLVNAASTAADGLVRGLTPHRQAQARRQLRRAAASGVDPAAIASVEDLLSRCAPRRTGRLDTVATWLGERLSRVFDGTRALWIAAIALALFSTAGLVNAVVTLSEDLEGGTGTDITTIGQMCGSTVAFVLCWVAIARLRGGRIWPVRMLRVAALVTILLTEVFNFVAEEFGALINVAVGLSALVVFSRRIAVLERAEGRGELSE
ncbi:hypothetical protein DEU38_12437 [Rhodococcus sp. AG1013]|uniref:hypothetical protein n=1 Tax=Rhodococcus sp. AG1013 TaxID=2183996 RepID=UPI000E0AB4BF|nr:hypothetical protein [Rhodococcus sp. AG1013]RDI16910.1 hypothetical protein DEU38_12437 [Rhodococcus sp. AG1013]